MLVLDHAVGQGDSLGGELTTDSTEVENLNFLAKEPVDRTLEISPDAVGKSSFRDRKIVDVDRMEMPVDQPRYGRVAGWDRGKRADGFSRPRLDLHSYGRRKSR